MDDKNLHTGKMNLENYPEPRVPADAAWAEMKKILNPSLPGNPPFKSSRPFFRTLLPYAGAGLIIAAFMIYYFSGDKNTKEQELKTYSTRDTIQQVSLTDGMEVYLNNFTSIRETGAAGTEKTLKINGGAYFDFTKHRTGKQAEYRLYAGTLEIHPEAAVLYTSSDTGSGISSVHVQSGSATVEAGEEKIKLTAGESVEYNEKTKQWKNKQAVNVNLFGYATKVFEFNNAPLKEAAVLIENGYGVKIIFENTQLYNCRITTRFDNKTLKEILDIMAYTLNFNYHLDEKNNRATLTGNGCE